MRSNAGEDALYVATNEGLFYWPHGTAGIDAFQPYPGLYKEAIEGNSAQIWSLMTHEDGLFVGAAERVYRVSPGSERLESYQIGAPSYCLYANDLWPDMIFLWLTRRVGFAYPGRQWCLVL